MLPQIKTIAYGQKVEPKVNDIAEPEWMETKGRAERAASLVRDVREFGPVGTADDGPTFAAAMQQMAAAGARVLRTPLDLHRIKTGFVQPSGIVIAGAGSGATRLDFSELETPATGPHTAFGAGLIGSGTRTLLPALAAAAVKDGHTLAFVSDPGLAPGDLVLIDNPADYSFSPWRAYYRNGEYARVVSSVAPVAPATTWTVTLSKPLYSGYPTTVNVYRIDPFIGGLVGVEVKGRPGQRSVKYEFAHMLRLEDIRSTGSDYAQIEVGRSFGVHLHDVQAVDYSTQVGLNYGISLGNSQHVSIDNCHLETARHGMTTGGGSEPGAIPCRDIHISKSLLNGTSTGTGVSGFSLHGNCEHVYIDDCTFPHGLNLAGDHVTLHHSHVWSSGAGIVLYGQELLGADFLITECDFHLARSWPTSPGAPLIFHWHTQPLTRTNGTFRFVDNEVDVGPYMRDDGLVGTGLYLFNNGSLPANNDIVIERNEVVGSFAPNANAAFGIVIRAVAGYAFRHIRVGGNHGNMGIRIQDVGPKTLDVAGGHIRDAKYGGLRVDWPASPVFSDSVITVSDFTVIGAHHCPIIIGGRQSDTTIILADVTALNGNEMGGTGSSSTDSSMAIQNARRVIRRGIVVGDTRATPKQLRADAIINVTTLVEQTRPVILGSVTQTTRTNVTSTVGDGTPLVAS